MGSFDTKDCDDLESLVHPWMLEFCDGVDNNCDGQIDEAGAIGENTYYADADSDGFGDEQNSVESCFTPNGYVAVAGDCNDSAIEIHPMATEICDDVEDWPPP